jgi:ferrous iron transport protein B
VQALVHEESGPLALTAKLDRLLTHPIGGYAIFFAVFFLVFQAVFTLATIPMDWIDAGMGSLAELTRDALPEGLFTDFLVEGVIAGIAGVVIFVPQIMILFGLIEILEETGYMARVSFLNDRLLRAVGMNGKSVVPLVSGFACAVPAIMSTRSIEDWKERLITIMVTPLMSCSARLPVYIFLVGFIVPDEYVLGIISLQGLFMLGLYLLGLVLSGLVAWVFNKVLKTTLSSSFILELPTYRSPKWRNVGITMYTKGLTFVTEAGKIILLISMVLWVLSTFGPSDEMQAVRDTYAERMEQNPAIADSLETRMHSELLSTSYAGQMGKLIEPAIRPLGYDWKMGIAIITSFAAREVFVGTMSILYSVEGGADNIAELQEQMKHEIHPVTGKALMSVPTASSLLIFFVIAMQCMSTLAITKRETNSWKWPAIQFTYLTALAYLASLITYQSLI